MRSSGASRRPPARRSASDPPWHSSMTKNGSTPAAGIARIDVEDGDDTGMRGRGERPRLALEAAGENGIAGVVRQEDLHRDVAVEPLVPGPMDRRHPTRTERRDDPISAGEEGPGGWHTAETTRCARIGGPPRSPSVRHPDRRLPGRSRSAASRRGRPRGRRGARGRGAGADQLTGEARSARRAPMTRSGSSPRGSAPRR